MYMCGKTQTQLNAIKCYIVLKINKILFQHFLWVRTQVHPDDVTRLIFLSPNQKTSLAHRTKCTCMHVNIHANSQICSYT